VQQTAGELNRVNRFAQDLFRPLPQRYDRLEALLSLGQNERWRREMIDHIEPSDPRTVLDVATGTAGVAIECTQRTQADVTGIDITEAMLREGKVRVTHADLATRVRLVAGQAECLPFPDASFDALTFTYLLRYVDDAGATLRELARVVRPGGTVAMLEFAVPQGVWRPAWEAWVRAGLPAAGRLISPGWHEVGRFLGPSIRDFCARYDPVALFRECGIEDVRARRLSLGGGIVVWGRVSA